jgi:hypothetical protein
MEKRDHRLRPAARAAFDLFLSHGAGVFFLFLASQSAPYSYALAAQEALHQLIEERVRTYLSQMLASVEMDEAIRAALIEAKTQVAAACVITRLPRCACRSQSDFARWLERQIADAVEDGDDGDPHGGSAALSPTSAVSSSWALHALPIARNEREAFVAAVLAALSPAEREILSEMAHPRATWVDVAASMELTLFEAKQLHSQAQARANEIAVQLAARAAGVADVTRVMTAA